MGLQDLVANKGGAAEMTAVGGAPKAKKEKSENEKAMEAIKKRINAKAVQEISPEHRAINTDVTRVLGYIVSTAPTVKISLKNEFAKDADGKRIAINPNDAEYQQAVKTAADKGGVLPAKFFERTTSIQAKYVKPVGNPKAVVLSVPEELFVTVDGVVPAADAKFDKTKVIVLDYEEFLKRVSQNTEGTVRESEKIDEAGSVKVTGVSRKDKDGVFLKRMAKFVPAANSSRKSILHPSNIVPLKAYEQTTSGEEYTNNAARVMISGGKPVDTTTFADTQGITIAGDTVNVPASWKAPATAESFAGGTINVTSLPKVKRKEGNSKTPFEYVITNLFKKNEAGEYEIPEQFTTWADTVGLSDEGRTAVVNAVKKFANTTNKKSKTSITGAELYKAYLTEGIFR